MARTAIIVIAHGSRGERGRGEVESTLRRIGAALEPLLSPGVEIVGAALQFNQPSLEDAAVRLARNGADRIVIAPYFLFPGRHITEHIPQTLGKLQQAYPHVGFVVTENLGLDESFAGLMAKRITEAAPDLSPRASMRVPGPIERQSLDIVQRLLPPLPGISGDELVVVKRVVHACGDPEVARLVRFSGTAVAAGVSALRAGCPIFTDVHMTAAGIDRRLAGTFGCSVSCALDAPGGAEAADGHATRTAAAMTRLGDRIAGAALVIGNAPTALLAVLSMVDRGIAPALVVGMPVGFVQAEESKEELMKRDVPYVTVVGTRGGSAMAAAAMNALLRTAADVHRREEVRSDEG